MQKTQKLFLLAFPLVVLSSLSAKGTCATVNEVFLSAQQAYTHGDYEGALALLSEGVEAGTETLDVHFLKARCFLAQNRLEDAYKELFSVSLEEMDPTRSHELEELWDCLKKANDESDWFYGMCMKGSTRACRHYLETYRLTDERAEEVRKKLAELEVLRRNMGKGDSYSQMTKTEKALAFANITGSMKFEAIRAYERGDFELAAAIIDDRTRYTGKSDYEGQVILVMALARAGDQKRAILEYMRLSTMEPETGFFTAKNEVAETLAGLDKTIRDAKDAFFRAEELYKADGFSDAIVQLDKAIQLLCDTNIRIQPLLIASLYKVKDYARVLNEIEIYLRLGPSQDLAEYHDVKQMEVDAKRALDEPPHKQDISANAHRVCIRSVFPKEEIRGGWDVGLRVTSLVYAKGLYMLDMAPSKLKQVYRTYDNYPRGELDKLTKDGYVVTELCYAEGKWRVFATMGKASQRIITGKTFPKEAISECWKEGYSITDVEYGDGLWVVVLTKCKAFGKQHWATHLEFPKERIREVWDKKSMRITHLGYANGKWVVVGSTLSVRQGYITRSAHDLSNNQSAAIDEATAKGRFTHMVPNGEKLVLLWSNFNDPFPMLN